jgi:putative endonuclease
LAEHNDGITPTCFTYKRRPVVLRYYAHFSNALQAISHEKNIKGWSRAKKKALIDDNIPLLKELARNNVTKDIRE